ncbi:MAG: PRC-barrel domain-containing protein [Halomonas sp.]|nr:PRC-barrel domain-containing protein [Halomonas sp.]
MKMTHRLIPVLAAALPLTAMAAPQNLSNWQGGQINEAWTLSQLLGDDVIAEQDTEVGEVVDVLFNEQGQIDSIIVYSNGNNVSPGYRRIDWPVDVFEPTDPLLSINQPPSAFGNLQSFESISALADAGGLYSLYSGESMVGMGVRTGNSPYGEVEDIVIANDRITSTVVDPDGRDTVNYRIPSELGWIGSDWVLVVPYSQSEIEQTRPYTANTRY